MGSICHGYMCILLNMKLIWCNGFPEIYAQLEEGEGSICHDYMCILLYIKVIWSNGFPEIYAGLKGVGAQLRQVHVHVTLCKTTVVLWCCIDLLLCGVGGGVNLPLVYVHSPLYEMHLV